LRWFIPITAFRTIGNTVPTPPEEAVLHGPNWKRGLEVPRFVEHTTGSHAEGIAEIRQFTFGFSCVLTAIGLVPEADRDRTIPRYKLTRGFECASVDEK
jgi:hypothetical protein